MKTTLNITRSTSIATLILSGLVMASPASASKLPESSSVAVGSFDLVEPETKPVLVASESDRYPYPALFEDKEGWAIVSLDIDETGKVSSVKLVDSSDRKLFAHHAMKTARNKVFLPATKDGKPSPVADYRVRVSYKLAESSS